MKPGNSNENKHPDNPELFSAFQLTLKSALGKKSS